MTPTENSVEIHPILIQKHFLQPVLILKKRKKSYNKVH